MADGTGEEIEDALQLIVNTAEQSVKMKKELKQTLLDTVSTLRGMLVKLHESSVSKTEEISKLEKQVGELKSELEVCRQRSEKALGMPSSEENHEPTGMPSGRVAQPNGRDNKPTEPDCQTCHRVAPPGEAKLYSEAVTSKKPKNLYQLTVRSIGNTTQDKVTKILKAKVNPTEIKVGINKYKVLNNGNILIGTNTKQEIEVLEKEIATKCAGELEANMHKLRKPRLKIYNIPEDVSIQSLEETLLMQNPDIGLSKGDISAKFIYTTKTKIRNLVIEVEAKARKLLLQSKIKLGWHVCRAEDYVVATRCFKCSRFNHRYRECKGEEACPKCAGPHRLKDCVADSNSFKCVNCTSYNKYNPSKSICTNHSSLDKECPSMLAILERYRKNTEY